MIDKDQKKSLTLDDFLNMNKQYGKFFNFRYENLIR